MTIKTEISDDGRIRQTVIDRLAQSHSIRIADTMEAGFRDALVEKSQHGLRYSTAPLKAALAEYDRTKPDRDALFEQIDSNEDIEAWEAEELAALRKVQEAFYEVTRDRNSRETCERVGVEFVRRLAEAYP